MTRFSGMIGFIVQEETAPGVWRDVIEEKRCNGEVLQNNNRWQSSENLNDNLIVDNKFSIVLSSYIQENLGFIKYLKWLGKNWKVTKIETKRPRLILTIGGLYNNGTSGTET